MPQLFVTLCKERQHIFIPFDSDQGSIWSRLYHILMISDGKEISSHTFRRKALQEYQRNIDSAHCASASEASINIKCFACTSSYSSQTDNHPIFLESRETPSREYGDPNTINCQLSQLATSIELVGYTNQKRQNPIEIDLKSS